MRAELARLRETGTPFGRAWRIALDAALHGLRGKLRNDWHAAFLPMRGVWAEAYERQPVARPLFVHDDEREPVEQAAA